MTIFYAVTASLVIGAAIGYAFRGYIGKGIGSASADATKVIADATGTVNEAAKNLLQKV